MPGSNVSVDFWAPMAWPADGFSLGLEPMYQYIDDIMMTYLQLAPSLSSGVDIIYTFADSFHATPGTLPSIDGPSFSTSNHGFPLPIHPTSITQGRACRWQGLCDRTISALPPGRVMEHLRRYHLNTLPAGTMTHCCWVMKDGTLCGKQVISRNIGKHVAALHLKSTARKCDRCGRVMSRSDSLWRHVKTCRGGGK